ncbi:uncharacterized protein LOC132619354 [Lycium barbarum]|uniref:uncharacterized protein LOC132619354 n=1 Tax=Lycium barbarum TaxID=112863 RepID=UPI00293E94E8|nr:uncharacterized protein LOC132619354 [Lycium barbarum]
MDFIPQIPKIKMVSGVPSKLRVWWEDLDLGSRLAVTRMLKFLPSLFQITPDKHIIRALLQFWDLDRVVFKFKDFELTPTLEEISYFTNLKYQGKGQIILHSQSGKKFLRYLGLNNTKELRCFEGNWVSLDYLYERYGCQDGYNLFKKEFSCTPAHWQARRPVVFAVALLGILVFPREYGQISTCICSVARALFEGVDDAQLALVPMILAEIFRALGKCRRGKTSFFEGCNILLQMWAMEHFYQRWNMADICLGESKRITSFYERTKPFVSPVGTRDWYGFLASRTGNQIQWKYPLLPRTTVYIRGRKNYYIELIGLKGLQPYALVRVLRQFGIDQVIPLQADMSGSEIFFRQDFRIPRAGLILDEWVNINPISIGVGPAEGSPEYRAWLQEDYGSIEPSPAGESGFEDRLKTIWIRHARLGTMVITPEMWDQMTNIMQYFGNTGARSNGDGASSSAQLPA